MTHIVQTVLSHVLILVEYTQSYDDVSTQLITVLSRVQKAVSRLLPTLTFFKIKLTFIVIHTLLTNVQNSYQ